MGIGRPTKPLGLTAEEREKVAMLARRPKSAQAMAMRARIILGCDEGLSSGAVAKKLQITGATVCKWRERFSSESVGRLTRRAPAGCSAVDHGHAGGDRDHQDLGVD